LIHYAAQVRRIPTLMLTSVLVLAAGCHGGAATGSSAAAGSFSFPTVSSDQPGTEPTIVSKGAPPDATEVKVLHEGKGRPVGKDDVLVSDVKGQVWDKGGVDLPPFVNSFKTGDLLIRPLDSVVPAWEKALPGMKVGSRVLLIAPPADGFGAQGNPSVGIFPPDTIMFVIDIVSSVAPQTMADGKAVTRPADPGLPTVTSGKNPKITVPKVNPPTGLEERVLVQGAGAKVGQGQTILAEYVGVVWRDGKQFDSSWDAGRHPFAARIATSDSSDAQNGVIEGWVKGLVGQKVGSRVLLVVPPKLGYGNAGNTDAGIKGTDTLVFVIDILGVYGNATTK
jgi:peptidylprolyl isomerase